jgi:hypothetical protein
MRKLLLTFAMASGLVPFAGLAQTTTGGPATTGQGGTTSGPAAGTNVQPGTSQGQPPGAQNAAPNPSGAAGAGAPGTPGSPGTEAGPGPMQGPQAQGMPGMPGMPQPGMGREHAEMMRRMMHGMHPFWMGPGAFFRFRRDGNEIVIKCAANEPTQVCVQAAMVLMDMVMKQGGPGGGGPGQGH